MAKKAADYRRGEMEIAAQVSTFHGFIGLMKWGALSTAVAVLFLSLWFCAGSGFFQAAGASVVVLVLGILVLREKPAAGH